jgi:hypothetical protein
LADRLTNFHTVDDIFFFGFFYLNNIFKTIINSAFVRR